MRAGSGCAAPPQGKGRSNDPGPRRGRARSTGSALDEPHVTGARALGGILFGELDALAFAEQLEHLAADGTAVEEVLCAALVADEPETLVDQEPCDCAGRHDRVLRLIRRP